MIYNPRGFIKGGVRPFFVHWRRILTHPGYRQLQSLVFRIGRLPRHQRFATRLWGNPWHGPDSASFLSAFDEVFVNRIYDFLTEQKRPRILDCGGNIGVSALYFLRAHEILDLDVFEPDPALFSDLRINLEPWIKSESQAVRLHSAAVYTHNRGVAFVPEGADSGHIDSMAESSKQVPSVRLSEFLSRPVDFLKLDVEGAEYEILEDCAAELRNVRQIFVEMHGRPSQPSRFGRALEILEKAGFRIQIHVPFARRRPYHPGELNAGMELQLNVFGMRA